MPNKKNKIDPRIPRSTELLQTVFNVIINKGGSATNDEILNQVAEDLSLDDEVVNIMHLNGNETELSYQR